MKKRKNGLFHYMEFKITSNVILLHEEDIQPGLGFAIQKADDEVLIKDYSPFRKINRNIGLGILAFLIWPLINLFQTDEVTGIITILVTSSVLLALAIFLLLLAFKAPDKRIVFNRLTGIVELPGLFWGKPFLIKFDELEPVLGTTGGVDFNFMLNVRRPRKYFWDHLILPAVSIDIKGEPEDDWSFIVWYMDKNRRLPPGSAFDRYREKDDLRRRQEGDPPPLYPGYY